MWVLMNGLLKLFKLCMMVLLRQEVRLERTEKVKEVWRVKVRDPPGLCLESTFILPLSWKHYLENSGAVCHGSSMI